MKKQTSLFIFLLFIVISVFSQNKVVSGKIVDAISKKGIPNVHIYSKKLGEGTFTNSDGNFYLIVSKKDELNISCIGYKKQIIFINSTDNEKLNILLETLIETLNEIVISSKPLTANNIIDKALKNFKNNHFIEPVSYKYYNRLVNYKKDSSLVFLEEYSGIIKQNWLHNTKYNIEKARIKYLSKDSIKQLKNHRVIAMDKMKIDNIYKYLEDYLRKKGKRDYNYKLIKRFNFFNNDCYLISFFTEKKTYYKKGELYIDATDFAIIRKTLKDKNDNIINDVIFKKNNKKWYLKKAENYHTYTNPVTITKRTTLYNLLKNNDTKSKFIKLTPRDFSFNFSGSFNDEFWGNNNIIPLPNWISKQIN